jgi:hypothetical protein
MDGDPVRRKLDQAAIPVPRSPAGFLHLAMLFDELLFIKHLADDRREQLQVPHLGVLHHVISCAGLSASTAMDSFPLPVTMMIGIEEPARTGSG